eukprot:scaffold97112_cov41-Prasinocladus_malaysianus.AAC.1
MTCVSPCWATESQIGHGAGMHSLYRLYEAVLLNIVSEMQGLCPSVETANVEAAEDSSASMTYISTGWLAAVLALRKNINIFPTSDTGQHDSICVDALAGGDDDDD